MNNIDTFGMTVEELLKLDADAIRSLDERNLSHAVRTLSLAANKRINRLTQYTKKNAKIGEYVEKAGGPGLDFTALYAVSERKKKGIDGEYEYGKIRRFGMGRTPIKTEQMGDYRTEFNRAANFLRAKSSTVAGAKKLRKEKERALFGETREEAYKKQVKKGMTKRQKTTLKKEIQKNFEDLLDDTYTEYNKMKEEDQQEGKYKKTQGRKNLRSLGDKIRASQIRIDELIKKGLSPEAAKDQVYGEAKQAVMAENTISYEERRRQENEQMQAAIKDELGNLFEEDNYNGLFDDENI